MDPSRLSEIWLQGRILPESSHGPRGRRLCATEEIGVSTAMVYKICKSGEIPLIGIVDAIRVLPTDIAAFIAARLNAEAARKTPTAGARHGVDHLGAPCVLTRWGHIRFPFLPAFRGPVVEVVSEERVRRMPILPPTQLCAQLSPHEALWGIGKA